MKLTRDRSRFKLLKFIESNIEVGFVEIAKKVNDNFNTLFNK